MLLCRPIFPVIFLDPDAPCRPATFGGDRAPMQSEFPGSPRGFPEGAGEARSPRAFPRPDLLCAALPCCGPAAGNVLIRGDSVCSARLRGRPSAGQGQAAGHTIAPTLPSSLPLGDVQPCQPNEPSRLRLRHPRVGRGFSSFPLLPAPKVTSSLPQLWGPSILLAQGHETGPPASQPQSPSRWKASAPCCILPP